MTNNNDSRRQVQCRNDTKQPINKRNNGMQNEYLMLSHCLLNHTQLIYTNYYQLLKFMESFKGPNPIKSIFGRGVILSNGGGIIAGMFGSCLTILFTFFFLKILNKKNKDCFYSKRNLLYFSLIVNIIYLLWLSTERVCISVFFYPRFPDSEISF